MRAEFDKYAGSYEELLRDPIRDRFAATGDFFHLRKWLLLRRLLVDRGARPAEMAWLDVGCGKGELLRFGSAAFGRAVGCDPSLEMLRECSGLTIEHQPEAARLPFADASFDAVTAACVYHHLSKQDQHALACEARRVLRPGGVFVIFEHNPWNPATRLIVSRTPVDANAVLLTGGECRNVVRAAGLDVESTVYYLFLPERVFRLAGGLERLLTAVPLGGQYAVLGSRPRS